MTQKSCVVIGAGLAGLAAAYRLTQKHWKVTVVEALDRLGGRVLSHRFDKACSLVCELGGEWIGDDHKEMIRLSDKFKLKLMKHRYAYSFWGSKPDPEFHAPGAWPLSPAAEGCFNKVKREYIRGRKSSSYNHELDKLDWWTKLQLAGFQQGELLKRDLMDSTDFGETIRQTSAYVGAAEYFGSPGVKADKTDEMDYKIEGGNDRLVYALADAIGRENIRSNFKVKRIRQSRGLVEVFTDENESASGQYCICTVPAHYLREIKWQGEVPHEQLYAARQLQYARITKTAVLCERRFWPKPKKGGFSIFTSLASDFCFDSTHGQKGTPGILCSYAVGDKADDIASSPVNLLAKWISGDVAEAFGKDKRKVKVLDVKRQAWQTVQDDPYTGGAYAFYRCGQWFTVLPALRKRHRRIYFAGEHLSENWQGFMEGAVETGLNAADKVARKAP
jgi:monoamine oxidase